jgi:hypothetical protein
MTPYNWKPILYISMIQALKFADDRYFWNVDIVEKLGLFDLKSTNLFEHMFLNLLDFELYVGEQEFDEYFKWFILYSKFREREETHKNSEVSSNPDQKMNVDN